MKGFSQYHAWRPTPLLWLSIGLCLLCPLLLLIDFAWWPWLLAIVVIDHLVMTVAGLLPRCDWLGRNWSRLPQASVTRGEVAITLDDGPDPEITPLVLDILDRFGAKASFFCIGDKVLRHPELTRDIVARGHGVANHSMGHPYHLPFCLLEGWFRELEAAQQAIKQVTGSAPRYFRAPVGLRNPLLEPVLARMGLQLVSWTRRGYDSVQRDPEKVLAKLLNNLQAGDILLLHDGGVARTDGGVPVILEVLPKLLEKIADAGLRTVTLSDALD